MSAIIDASLSRTPFLPCSVKKDTVLDYLCTLAECGVKYFEIDTNSLGIIGCENLSKKYIYRVKSADDAVHCRRKRFAYVVVPWKLRELCGGISKMNSVILEINADPYCAPAMIMHALSSKSAQSISMIRVNDYSYSPKGEEIAALLKWYRGRYALPIDICPINYYMTGNVCAVTAYGSGADSVTLTYGRNVETSSLENFIVEIAASKALDIPKEVVIAMSRAVRFYLEIFMKVPYGFNSLNELSKRVESPLADISTGQMYRIFRVRSRRKQQKENAVDKKVRSLGYDEQIEELIIQLLDKAKIS